MYGSSAVGDVEGYVIIRKLLDRILKYLWYSYAGGKSKHAYKGHSFRKVAYTMYDLPWFVE
jgi:hypothetical protein